MTQRRRNRAAAEPRAGLGSARPSPARPEAGTDAGQVVAAGIEVAAHRRHRVAVHGPSGDRARIVHHGPLSLRRGQGRSSDSDGGFRSRTAAGGRCRADWRDGLTRWATTLRISVSGALVELQVPITGPPLAPNNVAWLDNALQCQAETVSDRAAKAVGDAAVEWLRPQRGHADRRSSPATRRSVMPGYGAMLKLTSPQAFPALHRAIDSLSRTTMTIRTSSSTSGLARILDGLAAAHELALPDPLWTDSLRTD